MDRQTPEEYRISCDALGIAGCTRTFCGKTAGDVVDEIRDHLRAEHSINLPDKETILRSDEDPDIVELGRRIVGRGYSEDAIMVMRRLRELLGVRDAGADERQR